MLAEALDNPAIRRAHKSVMLAAAEQIRDGVSMQLLEADRRLGEVCLDDEAGFERELDALTLAEDVFFARHSRTEVLL